MSGLTAAPAVSRLNLFEDVAAFTPAAFAQLGQHVKDAWIVEAVARTPGHALLRRRKLPADRTLWLLIGMGLFRDRSIHAVAEQLDLALPGGEGSGGIAVSALPKARARLGVEPVERLFELSAASWAQTTASAEPWRGLSLLGVDGVCLRVPDTAANEAAFGRPGSGRSVSGYPQVRIAALMALRTHVLLRLSVGAFREGEPTLAQALWAAVPDRSLTLLDRGFLSWWALWQLQTGGVERHWLVRAKANVRWQIVTRLERGDLLVDVGVASALQRAHPELPETLRMRAVRRQVKGFRPHWVLTSLLDPVAYPASELALLYHERWEQELANDEIKTHLLERREALRSQSPVGIRQEVAGIAMAYNLVRVAMARVAGELGVAPRRISFLASLREIRAWFEWAWVTSPGALPRHVWSLERRMRQLVLPERRSARRYPRHVKIKMSNYARNHGRAGAVLK